MKYLVPALGNELPDIGNEDEDELESLKGPINYQSGFKRFILSSASEKENERGKIQAK